MTDLRDRLRGVLLGTAIGDALGLPFEGMSAAAIARRAAPLDRYRLFGARGFVSDDTEQSALVAQSLARHPRARAECVRAPEGRSWAGSLDCPGGSVGAPSARASGSRSA